MKFTIIFLLLFCLFFDLFKIHGKEINKYYERLQVNFLS